MKWFTLSQRRLHKLRLFSHDFILALFYDYLKVSGLHFHVWPDGRFVDICGYRTERLSLPELSVAQQQDRPLYEEEKGKIIAAARGAISTYIEHYYRLRNLDEQALKQELSRYYMDTREPVEQVALTDTYEELRNRSMVPYLRSGAYHLSGKIKSMLFLTV
ncbi:hypothetical protein Psfp_02886 [Pelotomaculum sp. FP]|uniref:hypothetical protein n=1 Tax=Pelotomaculum sp. FP TaxID=261474 RepID=UPI001066114C|nr:hypothetical protein [Pelotomaculum sp. FP]TEB14456.1 hypothetical protein Psfp_02886 [Pelotomaculum sp. FP]